MTSAPFFLDQLLEFPRTEQEIASAARVQNRRFKGHSAYTFLTNMLGDPSTLYEPRDFPHSARAMLGLERSKLFCDLSPADLQLVRECSVVREHPANQPIFQEGDPGDGIYIIAEGQVQISALVGQEQRRVLTRIGPGDFFGEMAVLDNEPRSASAITEQASTFYFIPRESLLKMLDTSPRLAVSLVREFSLRMRDFNRQYINEVLQAERLTLVGRFARTIAHDFKNPLGIIGLAADLLDMEKASPEMRRSAGARIRKQVQRLNNMIGELLEFTRGPRPGAALSLSSYAEFVREIIEELKADLEDKRIELVLRNAPPECQLALDKQRLYHVFANLIHNAMDVMPNGGKIYFTFETKANAIVAEIEDSGPGIAPEILPRLFEPFATFGKAKGTGLGLSICRKIVEDHGGWMESHSEPGRGAIFRMGLPRPAADHAVNG